MTTTADPARTTEADDDPQTFADLAARVDELRDRVHHLDHEAAALLEETLDAVTAFNSAGLITLVRILRSDARGTDLLYRAVDEPEVMALLVAHGIVRADRAVDVLRAVEQLRPHLVASGTDMEVVTVDGDIAHVRYPGGCSGASAEIKAGVRETLLARVPGLRDVVEVEQEPAGAFVPLTSLRVGPPA